MKKLWLIYFLILTYTSYAQDTTSRKVESVGLSVLKWAPIVISNNSKVPIIIEPSLYFNTKKSNEKTKKLIQLTLGYASVSSVQDSRIEQSLSAIYVKIGQQYRSHRVVRGFNFLMSANSLKSNIHIDGNYFPDFNQKLPNSTDASLGIEGYFGTKHKIANSLYFMWLGSVNFNAGSVGAPKFKYITGSGFRLTNDTYSLSTDVSLALLYKFP